MPCRICLHCQGGIFFLVSHPPRLNAKKRATLSQGKLCAGEKGNNSTKKVSEATAAGGTAPLSHPLCRPLSHKIDSDDGAHSHLGSDVSGSLSLSPALSSWREKCCNNEQRRVCKSVQRRVGGGRDRASPPSTYVRASPTIPLLPLSSSLRTLFAFFSPRVVRVTQEEGGKEAACLSGEQERVYLRGKGFDDISILNFYR